MRKLPLFRFLLGLSVVLSAEAGMPGTHSLDDTIQRGLQFLAQSQQKATLYMDHFEGEWPSYMVNTSFIPGFGARGKQAYDSNCFTTASVHNLLAEAWLIRPDLNQIPPLLDLAIKNILTFKTGETFNFWPLLPGYSGDNRWVHRPNHYLLSGSFLRNAANIVDDADDTAAAYLAMKLNAEIDPRKTSAWQWRTQTNRMGNVFASYRDRKRHNFNWYNLLHGGRFHTGAFLTWLAKENHLGLTTWFPRRKAGIPYGANEVDCVVNANVLNTLAAYDALETPGVKEACRYLDQVTRDRDFAGCAVYSPNRYHLHYALSNAWAHGARCLQQSADRVQEDLRQRQLPSGAWSTRNHQDELQATAYALAAWMNVSSVRQTGDRARVRLAIDYLFSNAIQSDSGELFWKGGNFFSGGTILKYKLMWRSDAYTTALIVHSLIRASQEGWLAPE